MSETAWTVLGLIITLIVGPFVAVYVAWIRKRLALVELSPEAKTAISQSTSTIEPLANTNDALVALALELGELKKRDSVWAMFAYQLEVWGLRGWARAPRPHEPMPQRPPRLCPDPDEMPPPLIEDTEG